MKMQSPLVDIVVYSLHGIFPQVVYDNRQLIPDPRELMDDVDYACFDGVCWGDIAAEDVRRMYDSLPYLSDAGVLCLLPAALKVCLTNPDEADVLMDTIPDFLEDLAKDKRYLFDAAQALVVEFYVRVCSAIGQDDEWYTAFSELHKRTIWREYMEHYHEAGKQH